MTDSRDPSNRALIQLSILAAATITVFHLGSTLAGYADFRDIHLGTALVYAKGRIELLKPVIVGFNALGTPTPQELPLWQAAAALVFKATGSTWFGWANITSLLCFAAGCWPLFQVAKSFLGEHGAWWTLLLFLVQPLILIHAGRAGTDGLCLTLMLWFLYFGLCLLRTGELKWWLLTMLFACLTAVSKLPFFMASGLCLFLLLLTERQLAGSWRRWALLASVGLVASVVFLFWSRYTDYQASVAEFPLQELRINRNPDTAFHFFGTWSYRLNPYNWAKGAWRIMVGTLGILALTPLLMAGLCFRRNSIPRYLLLGAFLTALIFTHLVLVHWHYYLMICPAGAMLVASAAARLEEALPPAWTSSRLFPLAVGGVLGLALVQGVLDSKTLALQYDRYPAQIDSILKQYTHPTDKLIIQGGGWGGREFICSGRQGLSVQKVETLARMCEGRNLARLQELGFNRLVMVGESPVLAAMQEANPGSHYKRHNYPASVSPIVDSWPVVFRNDDIIIKEVPPAGAAATPAASTN